MSEIIKKRTIKVDGLHCENCENKINDAISKIDGVKEVKADKSGKVCLEYDLIKVKLEDIEKKIESLGYKMKKGRFNKFKRGFIHDSERNEYETQTSPEPMCCSNPKGILDGDGKEKHSKKE